MTNRRTFLTTLLSVFGLGPVLRGKVAFAAKKLAIPLSKLPDLQKIGGSVIIKLRGKKVLFVRDTKDSIRALNPVCTHKECLVGYAPQKGNIACPCHGSHFTLSGKVLNGPATAPLKTYPAKLDKDRVIITIGE